MLFKKKTANLRPDLQEVMDTNKVKRNNKNKQIISDLLKDDETVIHGFEVRKGDRFGVMVLTTKRVIWASTVAGMPDIFTVQREQITGVDSTTNTLNLVTFTINTSGQNTEFSYGGKKQVYELMKQLN